jgi:ADP-L-glycero-D-manno-heptose 6-epimerase
MASVIFHAFSQIKKTGKMNLFKSHKSEFNHGEQLRDFIYVKDLIEVLYLMMNNKQKSGIYNLGTGQSRTFLDLVNATFSAMKFKSKISFIDIPLDIRTNYQYYTEAKMQKLNNLGMMHKFTSLEDGVEDYVKNYLLKESYF